MKSKKLRVNKKYGIWYYTKYKDTDMELYVYEVTKDDKTESYTLGNYQDVISCVKEPTKELREKYERIYG